MIQVKGEHLTVQDMINFLQSLPDKEAMLTFETEVTYRFPNAQNRVVLDNTSEQYEFYSVLAHVSYDEQFNAELNSDPDSRGHKAVTLQIHGELDGIRADSGDMF